MQRVRSVLNKTIEEKNSNKNQEILNKAQETYRIINKQE